MQLLSALNLRLMGPQLYKRGREAEPAIGTDPSAQGYVGPKAAVPAEYGSRNQQIIGATSALLGAAGAALLIQRLGSKFAQFPASIALGGTAFALNYASDKVPGVKKLTKKTYGKSIETPVLRGIVLGSLVAAILPVARGSRTMASLAALGTTSLLTAVGVVQNERNIRSAEKVTRT